MTVNNSRHKLRLYNMVTAPLWMIALLPTMLLIMIPANFVINSLVLIIGMYALKLQNKKQIYKKTILKVFLFSLLSYAVCAALMWLTLVFEISITANELYFTIPILIISAVIIFVSNYYLSFKKFDKSNRFKLSLIFAVGTAHYIFLFPTELLLKVLL